MRKFMGVPLLVVGNSPYTKSKNVKYRRNCDTCGTEYTGWGRFFCSKKCRTQPRGAASHSWKGDDITKQTGRDRAVKMYGKHPCQECGAERAEIHHVDGNPVNNDRHNIMFLCRKHHILIENRHHHMLRARGIEPRP